MKGDVRAEVLRSLIGAGCLLQRIGCVEQQPLELAADDRAASQNKQAD